MRNESRKSGSGRGGEKPVAERRHGACRLLLHVTVFRDDLGEGTSIAELQNLSRTKREAKLDAIRDACTAHIQGPMAAAALTALVAAAAERTGLPLEDFQVRADDDDKQTLLLWYPTATPVETYVRPAVKIESGAKSALDPNTQQIIRPYVDEDAPGLDLSVANVTTVDPERTFWDKVVILHGLRRWFERRGELRGGGQRISRHYYDIHRLMGSETGRRAFANRDLGAACVAHARMFFNRKDYDLASAEPPTFALLPNDEMVDALRRDYVAMAAMIFGPVPNFNLVLESVRQLETLLNAPKG
ncbi:nucleotidyl transferase AbiEii/AbiGii toxin family protein (plasmid) [Mesorhizobium sp. AR02]|uniref:nucleotidyl transferase AbiEii/AbiGii toxin family protein n=1 Tax=Mesorhizobium sp. AR02 TaxID=2865837 RepID=UPI00215E3C57|nr:nucleotidyl transferase AbiEii/AbiGii toxin family protein [Mesorhizobium sp. AR02]UVK49732.1 nucleotidyl transferase AbiEii/AbiGii toxin family protein [Mesorhizobium sp. AR02]